MAVTIAANSAPVGAADATGTTAPAPAPAERPRDRVRWFYMIESGSLDVFEQVFGPLPEYSARKRRALEDLRKQLDWLETAEAVAPELLAAISKKIRTARR